MTQNRPRRVVAFSGSRADYSPLLPLLDAMEADEDLQLALLLSGGHLVAEQGDTSRQIEADGFTIGDRVEVVVSGDSDNAVCKSFGLASIGYVEALTRMSPDYLLICGDRYEALAAAFVASQKRIPIIHLGGGQLTYGSVDDRMRHAITKLADVHLCIDVADCRRVIQMGEQPETVFHVGAVGINEIPSTTLLDRNATEKAIGITMDKRTFVITYHPATATMAKTHRHVEELLAALAAFPDTMMIFTGPNVDEGSRHISAAIERFVAKRQGAAYYFASLGRTKYLSLMKHADLVIGNSSSGLIEAPSLGTPTVNVGIRQNGRPRSRSVFDTDDEADEIVKTIERALRYGDADNSKESGLSTPPRDNIRTVLAMLKKRDRSSFLGKTFFHLERIDLQG